MARADSGYMSPHNTIYYGKSSQSEDENYQVTSEQQEYAPNNSSQSDVDHNLYPTTFAYPPVHPSPSYPESRQLQFPKAPPSQNVSSPLMSPGLQSYSPRLQPPHNSYPSPRLSPSNQYHSTTPSHSPRMSPNHPPSFSSSHFSLRSRDPSPSNYIDTKEPFLQSNSAVNPKTPDFKGPSVYSPQNTSVEHATALVSYDAIDEVYDTYRSENKPSQSSSTKINNSRQELSRIQQRLQQGPIIRESQEFQNYPQYISNDSSRRNERLPSQRSRSPRPPVFRSQKIEIPRFAQPQEQGPYLPQVQSPQTRLPQMGLPDSTRSGPPQVQSPQTRLPQMGLPDSTQSGPPQLGQSVEEEEVVKSRKREAAVKEIITTERTYVDGLRKAVKVFLLPLRDKATSKNGILSTKPVASMEDIVTLFGNMEQILTLHEKLLEQLEDRYRKWTPTEFISDIFLQIAPWLKMYTTYLKSFPQAMATMERLNKESPPFKKFLTNCSEKSELGGLNLNSFLILPIQRIPRYKLLLEAVFKYTDRSHPDYTTLEKCVEQISVIADDMNEKIRDAENQQKVIEIQYQVEGLPSAIVKPARRFIYKGDLYKVTPTANSRYASTLDTRTHFLFNDLILFCLDLKVGYIYKGHIDLAFASVKDIEDGKADRPYCFQIQTKVSDGQRAHTVRAKSEQEKIEWMDRIADVISALKNGIRSYTITRTDST